MKRYFVVFLATTMMIGLAACGKTDDTKITGDGPIASEVKNESLGDYVDDAGEQTEPELPPEEASQTTSSGQNLAELWWAANQAGTDTDNETVYISANDSPFKKPQTFSNYIEGGLFDFDRFMLDNGFEEIVGRDSIYGYDAPNYYVTCRVTGNNRGYCFIDYYFAEERMSYSVCISCKFLSQSMPDDEIIYQVKNRYDDTLISNYILDLICEAMIRSKTSLDPLGDKFVPAQIYIYPEFCNSHDATNEIFCEYLNFYDAPGKSTDGSYSMILPTWYLQK